MSGRSSLYPRAYSPRKQWNSAQTTPTNFGGKAPAQKDYEAYLDMLQQRNRALRMLNKKDKAQRKKEEREKGFSAYVNGSNTAKVRSPPKRAAGGGGTRRSGARSGHDHIRSTAYGGRGAAARVDNFVPSPPQSRSQWTMSPIKIKTTSGEELAVAAPAVLSGRYDDDFESCSDHGGSDHDGARTATPSPGAVERPATAGSPAGHPGQRHRPLGDDATCANAPAPHGMPRVSRFDAASTEYSSADEVDEELPGDEGICRSADEEGYAADNDDDRGGDPDPVPPAAAAAAGGTAAPRLSQWRRRRRAQTASPARRSRPPTDGGAEPWRPHSAALESPLPHAAYTHSGTPIVAAPSVPAARDADATSPSEPGTAPRPGTAVVRAGPPADHQVLEILLLSAWGADPAEATAAAAPTDRASVAVGLTEIELRGPNGYAAAVDPGSLTVNGRPCPGAAALVNGRGWVSDPGKMWQTVAAARGGRFDEPVAVALMLPGHFELCAVRLWNYNGAAASHVGARDIEVRLDRRTVYSGELPVAPGCDNDRHGFLIPVRPPTAPAVTPSTAAGDTTADGTRAADVTVPPARGRARGRKPATPDLWLAGGGARPTTEEKGALLASAATGTAIDAVPSGRPPSATGRDRNVRSVADLIAASAAAAPPVRAEASGGSTPVRHTPALHAAAPTSPPLAARATATAVHTPALARAAHSDVAAAPFVPAAMGPIRGARRQAASARLRRPTPPREARSASPRARARASAASTRPQTVGMGTRGAGRASHGGAPAPFSIPLLPRGYELEIELRSTWGDAGSVGLAGVDIYDAAGHEVVHFAEMASHPAGSTPVGTLFNGDNLTTDRERMWLAPFTGRNRVRVRFAERTTLALIRVWNYNATREESYAGARRVVMRLDGSTIFDGEISRAPGWADRGNRTALGEPILFTVDPATLHRIARVDRAVTPLA